MSDDYPGIERRQDPLEGRVRDLEETARNIQKSLPRVHERITAVGDTVKKGFDKLDKKVDCFTANCAAHKTETAEIKATHKADIAGIKAEYKGLNSFVKWSTGIYYAVMAVIAGVLWGKK